MGNINKVVVSGNITQEPQLWKTQTNSSVLSFSIAVNDTRKNSQTGEYEQVPNYFNCVIFGNRADGLSQYLHKGNKIIIEGKLHWSQWEKDGKKLSKVDIIVDSLDFAQTKNTNNNNQTQMQQQPNLTPQQAQAQVQQATAQVMNMIAESNEQPQQQTKQYELYEDIPF